MAEHTPGPWGVFDGVVGGTDFRKVFVQPTSTTREFDGIVAEMPMMSYPREVQVANAHLISASPDLLGALEEAYDELADTFRALDDHKQQVYGPVHALIMGRISAAITKAKQGEI